LKTFLEYVQIKVWGVSLFLFYFKFLLQIHLLPFINLCLKYCYTRSGHYPYSFKWHSFLIFLFSSLQLETWPYQSLSLILMSGEKKIWRACFTYFLTLLLSQYITTVIVSHSIEIKFWLYPISVIWLYFFIFEYTALWS
jgi:hypothetical protein